MSLIEIAKLVPVTKGSLSLWLRPYPLTLEERRVRMLAGQRVACSHAAQVNKKPRGEPSKHWETVSGQVLRRDQSMAISEAAILFRLALHGFNTLAPVFDGAKMDWLVEVPPPQRTIRIQVKTVRISGGRGGLPVVPLLCRSGQSTRRYLPGEFDVIVGYDLYTDTAYVFTAAEVVKNRKVVSIRQDAAERWDKLLLFDGT